MIVRVTHRNSSGWMSRGSRLKNLLLYFLSFFLLESSFAPVEGMGNVCGAIICKWGREIL
jgi:hypothetical protein